ncbi:MAG TPA: 2-oxoglutarate dehydrogenase E1 component, partial [Acidobacteriaceae bacterium]
MTAMPIKSPAPQPSIKPDSQPSSELSSPNSRESVFDIFRRWGYLQASLDPLGQYLPPEPFPTPAPDGPQAEEARRYYCGTIGAEFMHIPSPEKRAWIQERLERAPEPVDTPRILSGLIRADLFEQVIQQRYLGTKRFSLEGLTVLIPFL